MKQEIKYISFILLLMLPILNSCNKKKSCENCRSANDTKKPPIAVAGPDQVITLPIDSVLLDGRSSSDPDGTISSFQWTKISGPISFNISNSNARQTQVTNLVQGVYLFELKVTNAGGLFSKSTVRVTVIYLPGTEYVFHAAWGVNDLPGDDFLYTTTQAFPDLFSDPGIPLEVSVLPDNSSVWVNALKLSNTLPSNTQYYYDVHSQVLWVWVVGFPGAYNQLNGKGVSIKVKFL